MKKWQGVIQKYDLNNEFRGKKIKIETKEKVIQKYDLEIKTKDVKTLKK